MLSVTVVLGGP